MAAGKDKKIERERSEFFELAWRRCESFVRAAQAAYTSRIAQENLPPSETQPTNPTLLAPVFRERLRAAMHIPAMEAIFPALPPAAFFPTQARNSPRRRSGGRCWAGARWSCWPNRWMQRIPNAWRWSFLTVSGCANPSLRPSPHLDSRTKKGGASRLALKLCC